MTIGTAVRNGTAAAGEFRAGAASLIGSLCCMMLGPAVVGFYTFSLFLEPLGAEIGAGRAVLSLAITVGTLATAVSAPWIGWLVDRYDERRVLVAGSLALGLVLASLYFLASSLAGLYAMFAAVGVLCSAFYVAVPRVISSLFDRHRGLALGLVMSGTGLGTFIVMPLAQHVIASHGWRWAYVVIGALVLCVSLPCAAFLIRAAQPRGASRQAQRAGAVPRGLMRSRNFVLLAAAYFCVGLSLHGVIIHFVPMLTSRDVTPEAAAAIYAVAGMAIFAGRIGCGLLMDRLPAHRVGAALFLLAGAGVLLIQLRASAGSLYLAAVLFGLGIGAEMDVLGYLVSRLFALDVFARTYGLIYGAFMIGTSLGPLLFGHLFDRLGNYGSAAGIAVVLALAAGVMLHFLRPVQRAARSRRVGEDLQIQNE